VEQKSSPIVHSHPLFKGYRIPVMIGGVLVEGSPASTVSFVVDLTERRAAQEALARTQDQFGPCRQGLEPRSADGVVGAQGESTTFGHNNQC